MAYLYGMWDDYNQVYLASNGLHVLVSLFTMLLVYVPSEAQYVIYYFSFICDAVVALLLIVEPLVGFVGYYMFIYGDSDYMIE